MFSLFLFLLTLLQEKGKKELQPLLNF